MDKFFICLECTKERINGFSIGYMFNPGLNITKAFRKKVRKCMNNTFVQSINFLLETHEKKRIQEC